MHALVDVLFDCSTLHAARCSSPSPKSANLLQVSPAVTGKSFLIFLACNSEPLHSGSLDFAHPVHPIATPLPIPIRKCPCVVLGNIDMSDVRRNINDQSVNTVSEVRDLGVIVQLAYQLYCCESKLSCIPNSVA